MRNLSFLLATPLILVSCIPEGSGTQGSTPPADSAPSAPLNPFPTAPQQPTPPVNHTVAAAPPTPSYLDERLQTQNERLGRLETELHEMRLLFTNQLKRIEEVANRPTQLPASAYQQQQQPQQVVILPNSPVVTHRWDQQPTGYGSSNQTRAHQVRGGDTFSEIAEAYGLPTNALIAANPGVDPLRLQIGARITIPSSGQAAQYTAHARTRPRSYTVQSGDTLSQIAEAYGIGLSQLLAFNPEVDPKRLRVGKDLRIPQATSAASTTYQQRRSNQPAGYASPPMQSIQRQPQSAQEPSLEPQYKSFPSPTPKPPQEKSHKMVIRMKQPTTLGEVAEKHGTDVATLNRLNHTALSAASYIPINGTLTVPTSAPTR